MAEFVPEASQRLRDPDVRELAAQIDGIRTLLTVLIKGHADIMDERDRRYMESSGYAKSAADLAVLNSKEAARAALQATDKAAVETAQALKEYKMASNEWRDTVKELVSRLPSRTELEAIVKSIEAKIDRVDLDVRSLRESPSSVAGTGEGQHALWGYAVQALTIIIGIMGAVGLTLHFAVK